MHRYNICHRQTTGELLYLGKQQQWVKDMTQAITLRGSGAESQRVVEGSSTANLSGVFLVPLHQATAQTNSAFSVVPKQSQPAREPDVSVARRA